MLGCLQGRCVRCCCEDRTTLSMQLEQTLPSSLDPSAGYSTTQSDPPSDNSKMTLPKLSIQPLKGEHYFTIFWDSYQVAISDISLSNSDRFNYFVPCCRVLHSMP